MSAVRRPSSASPAGAPTDAHVEGGRLMGDGTEVRNLLRKLGSVPVHAGGDRFKAQPRRKIPEREKPTPAMQRAQLANAKKA